MPPATNFLIHYGGSSQTESLGDAYLIAVLASVTMVLHVIDLYVKNTNKIKWRQTICIDILRGNMTNNPIITMRIWQSLLQSISHELPRLHETP